MKLKLERVTHYENDKEGKPLVTRNGKPYVRCVIQTTTERYSGFGSQTTKGWKAGDEVEIEVTQNGQYLNFSIPKPKVVDYFEFIALTARVEALEKKVSPIEEQVNEAFDQDPYPPQEPN